MTSSDLPKSAEKLIACMNPAVRAGFDIIASALIGAGCHAHVKTIYVGFTLGDEMVAAAYPHSDHCELALSLPLDYEGDGVIDVTHLTWRTLPVGVDITSVTSAETALPAVLEAANRVAGGTHDVDRPPEYFKERNSRTWRMYGPLSNKEK